MRVKIILMVICIILLVGCTPKEPPKGHNCSDCGQELGVSAPRYPNLSTVEIMCKVGLIEYCNSRNQ